jgi:hypothetical protein
MQVGSLSISSRSSSTREVMSKTQARLLGRPDVVAAIDELAADPSVGVRRGRPRRR